MKACPATTASAGFTLLEVLVALTLMAFLAALVFQGLGTGARTWAAAERSTDRAADSEAVRNLLARAIGDAYPGFLSTDRTDHTLEFMGEPETLTLVAPLPDALESGVLARQRFRVTGEGQDRVLVLEWQLDLPGNADGQPSPVYTAKLLDHVESVQFGYFGSTAPSQPATWLRQWEGKSALPELVSVHLGPDGTGQPALPELVVEPRRAAGVACVYDPADVACRRVQ